MGMSFRSLVILIALVVTLGACNSGSADSSNNEESKFTAVVDTSMTLLEVAKTNNIGEPYLRTMLGIKKGIGKTYALAQMTKRFDFTIEDLKSIIEDRKNDQIARKKKLK